MPVLPVFFCLCRYNGRYHGHQHLSGTGLKFILYARSSCSLCEAMEEELIPFIEKYNLTVNRRYIDNEAALQERYGDKVPVLTLNEKILCHYFLDKDILLEAITRNSGR